MRFFSADPSFVQPIWQSVTFPKPGSVQFFKVLPIGEYVLPSGYIPLGDLVQAGATQPTLVPFIRSAPGSPFTFFVGAWQQIYNDKGTGLLPLKLTDGTQLSLVDGYRGACADSVAVEMAIVERARRAPRRDGYRPGPRTPAA